MKLKKIIKIKFILLIGILSVLSSCNDEDDIKAIFVGQTWYLGDFYTTTNWKDDNNCDPIYSRDTIAMKIILGNGRNRFYISFEEKKFIAKGLNNTFSGTWSADGKNNTISFHINNGTAPSGDGLSEQISRRFYEAIQNAEFYRGNTIWVKFFPQDKKSFMQLTTENRRK